MEIKKVKTIKGSKNKMTIETIVKSKGEEKSGDVEQLKIKDKDGKEYKITSVPDDVIIDTEGSPGCRWYFYRGRWIRVC